MPRVLAFTESSHKLVAPSIDGGLPDGLVLQLWIRRTGSATRQPIVDLAADGSRLVLRTGDRADALSFAVITGGKTREIVMAGALPADRWVQVRANLTAKGWGSLTVLGVTQVEPELGAPGSATRKVTIGGGFVGELAQLQIWRHVAPATLSWDPPPLKAPNLWAYYALEQATLDANSKKYVSPDAGPNQRHATGTAAPTAVDHDEPLADGGGQYVQFAAGSAAVRTTPLPGLGKQLTIEAWIRPDSDALAPVLRLNGGGVRLGLAAGGKDDELALMLFGDGKVTSLVRATGLVKQGEWSHVAATIGVNAAQNGLVVSLFHQGVLKMQESVALIGFSMTALKELLELLRAPMIAECVLGGASQTLPAFHGGMAEARVWASADQARLASMWLARARGDEPGLAACYRLDAATSGRVVDVSSRRGWAQMPAQAKIAGEAGPPIASTSGRAFRIAGRGKLVRERLNIPSSKPALKSKILLDIQPNNPTSMLSSVHDASIQVTARDGNSVQGRTLEVQLDRARTAVIQQGEQHRLETWDSDKTHRVALPPSGKVRLRFLAEELACPTIRVRVAGAPGGVWTPICPDEPAQARLRATTAASLKSPGEGRASPLPAGASDDDAAALADAFQKLGSQLRPAATTSTTTISSKALSGTARLSWGDIEDAWDEGTGAVEDVVNEGVDYVEEGVGQLLDAGGNLVSGVTRNAKSASKLIVRGAGEVAALTKKAAGAVVQTGERAVSQLIDSADAVAVVAKEGVRWVEIVGTTIVDGAQVAWRAVVTGVEEALAAVAALVKRIGAEIEKIIEYLAYLFAWDDFLARSDEYHALIESGLDELAARIAGLAEYKAKVGEMLRSGVEQAIGQRSLGDLLGVDADDAAPVFEDLEYFLELVQSVFESDKLSTASSAAGGISLGAALTTQADALAGKMPDMTDVRALLGTPVAQLVAGNGSVADGSSSLLDAVFDGVVTAAQTTANEARSTMLARLSVPWLTDMIEETILGGRKLTMARIIALTGAIPAVLTEKTQKSPKSTKLVTTTKSLGATKSGGDAKKKSSKEMGLIWTSTALGIVNSVLLIAKTAQEYGALGASNPKGDKFVPTMIGALTSLRGVFTLFQIPYFPAKTRGYSTANGVFELLSGAWTFLSVEVKSSKVNVAVSGTLGLAMTTTSAIAMGVGDLKGESQTAAFSLRCASWVMNALARLSEKADDDDASGKVKMVTGGLAVVGIAVDLTEAIFSNYADFSET